MILRIHINNFKLIENTEVDFSKGLNVITGETGTGKTIFVKGILSAFGFYPAKDFFEEKKNSYIEVILEEPKDDEGFIVLRRELSEEGRVLSYVDGRLAKADTLKEISNERLIVHSQNSTITLLNPLKQLNFLDSFDKELRNLTREYDAERRELLMLHERYVSCVRSNENLEAEIRKINEFIDEVERFGISDVDEEELKEKAEYLKNFATITELIKAVLSRLHEAEGSAIEKIGKAYDDLVKISSKGINVEEQLEKLNSAESIINEVCIDLSSRFSLEEVDLNELENIEKLLYEIQRIKNKYGIPFSDKISDVYSEKKTYLDHLKSSLNDPKILKDELMSKYSEFLNLAKEISQKRSAVAKEIEENVNKILKELMVGEKRFKIELKTNQIEQDDNYSLIFKPNGLDSVNFLFRAEKDEFKPISKIASGGELSRLMLALETIQKESDHVLRTYVFDEIDAGIGGKTAAVVGRYLKLLSRKAQIICITHLPQIAVFADKHFVIEREKDKKAIVREIISEKERIDEVARMLSGDLSYEAAKEHAKELLKEALSSFYEEK